MGMNEADLNRLDPTKKQKIALERAFIRLPAEVKAGLKKKANAMRPKLSLNSYILHICLDALRK